MPSPKLPPSLMLAASMPSEHEELASGPPRIPTDWPLQEEEWREYQKAKLRQATTTQIALAQFRKEAGAEMGAVKERLQAIHTRIEGIDRKVDDIAGIVTAVKESTGEMAEHLGRLAADVYGHSKDTRKAFSSISDMDRSQDEAIAQANEAALVAQAEAKQAREDAAKSQLEASFAKREAAQAKTMARWKVSALLAAGPAVYAVFKVVYTVLNGGHP